MSNIQILDKNRAMEDRLNDRLLKALADAVRMAEERGLIVAIVWTLDDVHDVAKLTGHKLDDDQARRALDTFATYEVQDHGTMLDAIWAVIA